MYQGSAGGSNHGRTELNFAFPAGNEVIMRQAIVAVSCPKGHGYYQLP